MQYMRSFKYIFEHKDWLSNVLMILVCSLIPVLGQLVLLGYMFELIEFWRANPSVSQYPKFDFNRFSPYLKRGVWPFLVNLIIGTVISLPIMFCSIGLQMVTVFAAREAPILAIPLILLFVVVILGGSIIAGAVTWPAILHAGFKQGIDFSGMIAFVKDFLKKVGKEAVLALAFIVVAGTVLGVIGVCALFIGAWVAGAIITMSYHHLSYQIYELYLQRGGAEVTPASSTPAAAPPAYAEPVPPTEPPDERIRPG